MIARGKEILTAWMPDQNLLIQAGLFASCLALGLTASVRPVNETAANAAEVLPVVGHDIAFMIDTLDGHVSLERVASFMPEGEDHPWAGGYPPVVEVQGGDTDITVEDLGQVQSEFYEIED